MLKIFVIVLFLAGSGAAIKDFSPAPSRILRHVVLFKFKQNASPDSIRAVENSIRGLSARISEIKGFEWGTNSSPEGLAQGFTHCFFVTFASEKDRDIYLPHPEHKKFTQLAGPVIEKVCVVDYWTK